MLKQNDLLIKKGIGKVKKCFRLLGFCLTFLLLFSATATMAFAAGETQSGVYVIVDGNKYDAGASGSGWKLTMAGSTSTISLNGYNGDAIYASGDLNIELSGKNTITSSKKGLVYGIFSSTKLVIGGSGSLDINVSGTDDSSSAAGIDVVDDITISAPVSIKAVGAMSSYGIAIAGNGVNDKIVGDVFIKKGAALNIEASLEPIKATSPSETTSGEAEPAGVAGARTAGISVTNDPGGSLSVEKDASVTINVNAGNVSGSTATGIYGNDSDMDISGNLIIKVEDADKNGTGIANMSGSVILQKDSVADISAEGTEGYGIIATDALGIGGKLNCKSENIAVASAKRISLTDGARISSPKDGKATELTLTREFNGEKAEAKIETITAGEKAAAEIEITQGAGFPWLVVIIVIIAAAAVAILLIRRHNIKRGY